MARLWPELVPASSAIGGGVDPVFTVRTGDVVFCDGPGIPGIALRGVLRLSHEGLLVQGRSSAVAPDADAGAHDADVVLDGVVRQGFAGLLANCLRK